MKLQTKQKIADSIRPFHLPRYEQIPDSGMYLEQTAKYICESLNPVFGNAITTSMISNYVKKDLIDNPVKKLYNREQIAYLIFIAVAKNVMSLDGLINFIALQKRTYDLRKAYDYFCVELEKALQATFSTRDFSAPSSAQRVTPESELVRLSALTFANKLFAIKFLERYDLSRLNEKND